MKTIRISEPVWNAIAQRGRFGETPDDVLRRVFKIKPIEKNGMRQRAATRRMTAQVKDGHLAVKFADGASRIWPLPSKDNKRELRTIRDTAISFAEQEGATEGQLKALLKALTSAGYHLTK